MSGADTDPDRIPTDAELDALQAQIEDAKDDMSKRGDADRRKPSRPGGKLRASGAMQDAHDKADIPDASEHADSANAQRIVELETELATLKDRALRAMADAENVKKRAEREVRNANIYGVEKFAGDILGVFDNLTRALASVDGEAKEGLGENAKNLLDGLELTEKNLMAVLARHGIKAVSGKGSKFDPNVHQAVAQIPSDEAKGDVAEVMQTGFTLGERTLRAAMVAVSTGKA